MPPAIILVHGTASEQQAREILLHWFERYSLDKWLYTEIIRIEEGIIPHSHPVLTLSPQTRWSNYLADPDQLLAAYIHEQLHWFTLLEEKASNATRAMDEFRNLYPALPVDLPEGCGSDFSNYLHIMMNYLEYQGLMELLGIDAARSVIARIPHYTKIYTLVVEETKQVGTVMTKYGMVLDERPPKIKRFVDVRASR